MLAREEVCRHLCIAFMHQIPINHSATVALVARDVLLADHVGRAGNPIYSVLAVVAINIDVDCFRGRQI